MSELADAKRHCENLLSKFRRDKRAGRVIMDDFHPERVDAYSQKRRDEVVLWARYVAELEAIENNTHENYLDERAYYSLLNSNEEEAAQMLKTHNHNRWEVGKEYRNMTNDGVGLDSMHSTVAIMELIQ